MNENGILRRTEEMKFDTQEIKADNKESESESNPDEEITADDIEKMEEIAKVAADMALLLKRIKKKYAS